MVLLESNGYGSIYMNFRSSGMIVVQSWNHHLKVDCMTDLSQMMPSAFTSILFIIVCDAKKD